MADYEVPDKLSILTYLSQFYQVFGAQENSLRLKRSSTSEANKSSPTTPPAKDDSLKGTFLPEIIC
jgi:hypothetical protein